MPRPTSKNQHASAQIQSVPKLRWLDRLVLFVVVVVIATAYIQRQAIADWIQLAGYTPPTSVASMATDDTMTPLARHLFYLNRPDIEDKQAFASDCKAIEKSIVLGCYHGNQNGIYILKITSDPELQGVMQVTSAHEMLHAAYDRLSSADRRSVDRQLQDFYKHGLKDQQVKDEIASYTKSEPGQVVNEMHSIFGTEVANLPSDLERYYQRYFTNRATVTKFAANYRAAFTTRQSQVKQYDAQLAELKTKIETGQAELSARAASLDAQRTEMDQLKSSRSYDEYNARVPGFNRQIRAYNDLRDEVKGYIDQYNQIVVKRNTLALQVQQLAQELSGDELPAPQP